MVSVKMSSKYKYKCYDCGKYFNKPKEVEEYMGEFWGVPAYDKIPYCPFCNGDFGYAEDVEKDEEACS